jgi:hypothetical protein
MPEIGLQRSGVMTVVGELVTATVAQHVRMRLEGKPGLSARALDLALSPVSRSTD